MVTDARRFATGDASVFSTGDASKFATAPRRIEPPPVERPLLPFAAPKQRVDP